ncbi:hypothetical protein [Streptomyces sp. NPDC088762]
MNETETPPVRPEGGGTEPDDLMCTCYLKARAAARARVRRFRSY